MTGVKGMRSTKPTTVVVGYDGPGSLDALDRRFSAVRTAIAWRDSLLDTIAPGGDATPQQAALAERATCMHVRLQQLEGDYLAGRGLDAGEYVVLSNALNGIFRTLGTHRSAKPARRLSDILEGKAPR